VEGAPAEAAYGSDVLDLLRGLSDQLGRDGGRSALGVLETHLARRDDADRIAARLQAGTTFLQEAVPALGLAAALVLVGQDVARGGTDPLLLAAAALGVLGAFEAVGGWARRGLPPTESARRPAGSEPSATRARQSWNPRPLPPPTGAALVFAGVSLWYPDSTRPALVGFDLCVRVGEKVAFTGRSGRNRHTRVQPPAE
jgi:ABC-type transport system involved in cytochrome bd biosynthesis fused ATPase/permease subunit